MRPHCHQEDAGGVKRKTSASSSSSTCPIKNRIQRVGCRLFSSSSSKASACKSKAKAAAEEAAESEELSRNIRQINLPALIGKREVCSVLMLCTVNYVQ